MNEQAIAWVRGITAYAWWKDGTQYVGTCGQTLGDALLFNPYAGEAKPRDSFDFDRRYWSVPHRPHCRSFNSARCTCDATRFRDVDRSLMVGAR